MKISTIVIDWSKVCTITGMSRPMSKYLADKLGIDKETVRKAYKSVEDPYVKGQISGEEYFRRIVRRLKVKNVNIQKLLPALTCEPEINTDVFKLLKELKKKYRLILFSDSFKEMAELIVKKYQLKKLFANLIFSHELKLRKPERQFYQKLIEITRLKSQESLFIDDRQENLDVAKKLGFQTVLYINVEKLIQDLKAKNII